PRHLSRLGARARLRRGLPRRGDHRARGGWPLARPRRGRARHRRRAARAPPPARASLRGVTRRYVPLLLTLSALWGASYLFIKVGVRDFAPTVLVELRLLLAAAVLVGFLWLREGRIGATASLRAAARAGIVLGLLNAAIPSVLIAWGERHIDSGVAAVANATVPIFNALLVLRFNPAERVTGTRFAGVLAGLAGVAVLAGLDPRGGWWAVAGILAVVVASISYAGSAIYAQLRLSRA